MRAGGMGGAGQATVWECERSGGGVGDGQEEMWVLPALTFRTGGPV